MWIIVRANVDLAATCHQPLGDVSGKLLDGDLGVRPSTELVRRMGTWYGNKHVTLDYLSDPHLLSSDARAAEFGAPFFLTSNQLLSRPTLNILHVPALIGCYMFAFI